VDRITRKDLKSDKFAQEVGHTFEFLSTHPTEVKRYGAIALVVLLAAGGIFFYSRHQETARKDALDLAIRMDDATVGPQQQQQAPPGTMNFPTGDAKDKALKEAFSNVAAKYHGTQEGAIAQLYLGSETADRGDLKAAENIYKDVADSAPAAYASVAKMSLAQLYASEGKTADAEKLLREIVAKPTAFISKEEATIVLAQLLVHSNPTEARKLLEPLRTSRTAISRMAIQTLGMIPASTSPNAPSNN
jgi:predicted negative regulator of RcsB-dependent stress response